MPSDKEITTDNKNYNITEEYLTPEEQKMMDASMFSQMNRTEVQVEI